jgi:hypothetical protein
MNNVVEIEIGFEIGLESAGIIVFYDFDFDFDCDSDFDCDDLNRQRFP